MQDELRVFFDADVLIAGSASTTGASHLLLHLSDLGMIRGLTSQQTYEEAQRNLIRKIPTALAEFDALLQQAIEVVGNPSGKAMRLLQNKAHPKDCHVLASAISQGAQWLVTFNLKDYYDPPGIRVLDPGQAVQTIRATLVRAAAVE